MVREHEKLLEMGTPMAGKPVPIFRVANLDKLCYN